MAKLIIEGDKKHLENIAKRNRSVASKYGLKISLENNKQEASKPPVKNEQKPKSTPKKKGGANGSNKAK